MRILGIDPGFGRVGFGILSEEKGKMTVVTHGLIETSACLAFEDRLFEVHLQLKKIIKKYSPTLAAIEQLFFYKNLKTAIDVAQARGVILLTVKQAGIAIEEYTPLEVKQALTGYGRAEKKQVQQMVEQSLGLSKGKLQDDVADALAIAITAGTNRSLKQVMHMG